MREPFRHSRHITRGPRWRALRMAVLERDGWACVDCGARGRLECDHVQPVRLRPDLAFDPDNLAARCPSCHSAKTRVEVGNPAPTYDRQGWRQAVVALMAPARPFKQHGDNDA